MSLAPHLETRRKLRRDLFILAILVAGISITAYLWPIDRTNLVSIIGRDGKEGFINTDGRLAIEPKWDRMWDFDSHGMAAIRKDDKWGYIDKYGRVIVEPTWEFTLGFQDDHMAVVVSHNDASGFIDRSGKVVIEPKWETAEEFGYGDLAPVQSKKDGKWGWINRQGKVVIPTLWDANREFDSLGMAPVRKGKLWGWVNLKGEIVIDPQWSDTSSFHPDGWAGVSDGILWGIIDTNGELVVPYTWNSFKMLLDTGTAVVRSDNSIFRINKRGKTVFLKSDLHDPMTDEKGYTLFLEDYKYGWNNWDDTVIIPAEWDYANKFDANGLAYVFKLPEGSHLLSFHPNAPPIPPGAVVFEESMGQWINRRGKTVLPHLGHGWKWRDAYLDLSGEKRTPAAYVVENSEIEMSWTRKKYLQIANWLDGNNEPIPETEFGCIVYNSEGDVIWRNDRLQFETKCMIAFLVALVLAFFTRPRFSRIEGSE